MTSDRSYRKAMTQNEAIKELLAYRDTHYDGHILDAFIEMMREG